MSHMQERRPPRRKCTFGFRFGEVSHLGRPMTAYTKYRQDILIHGRIGVNFYEAAALEPSHFLTPIGFPTF